MKFQNAGIYIHFPFCRRQCFYCHFPKTLYNKEKVDNYIHALLKEIRLRSNRSRTIDSMYIGGGSPSLLQQSQLATLLEALDKSFSIDSQAEITLECNPEDLNIQILQGFKKLGINRLSIGVQSFVNEDLAFLKRNHNAAQSISVIHDAQHAGFTNIAADFIIGLPHQSKISLEASLSQLKPLAVSHISAYILEQVDKRGVTQEKEAELYTHTRDYIKSMGFYQYEVSNFSKCNFESRHNLKYWEDQEYLGLGLGAAGFENSIDYCNYKTTSLYLSAIKQNRRPIAIQNTFPRHQRQIITGLRLIKGIPASCFEDHKETLTFLLSHQLLIEKKGSIAVHPDKILLLNEILAYFF